MTLSIASAIAAVIGAVGAYFTWKTSAVRQRRMAEKDVRKQRENREMKKNEIRSAVYGSDDEKLNRIVSRILAPALALAITVLSGCRSSQSIVYVPTDRRIETCTNTIGITCKAVPNAVFAEMLEKIQRLNDLETDLKVNSRLLK